MKKLLVVLLCILICVSTLGLTACKSTTVEIGENGNWWIDGTDTGYNAVVPEDIYCIEGVTLTIGGNGNWWMDGVDTGHRAVGIDGKQGRGIVKIEIIDNCVWITYSDDLKKPVNVGSLGIDYDGTAGLDFYPLQDGTYGVEMGKTKYLNEIIIPATYNGKAVTQILPYAFANCYATSITIPSSVTTIGSHAFDGAKIQTLTIPASVKYVYDNVVTQNNLYLNEIAYNGNPAVIHTWALNWNTSFIVYPKPTLASPIENATITHHHGEFFHNESYDYYSNHQGVCILADAGTAVKASFTGTVTEINVDDLLVGPYVTITGQGFVATYHFINATGWLIVGDVVEQGTTIGYVSEAVGQNYKLGPHIWFELFDLKGNALDPEEYISFS